MAKVDTISHLSCSTFLSARLNRSDRSAYRTQDMGRVQDVAQRSEEASRRLPGLLLLLAGLHGNLLAALLGDVPGHLVAVLVGHAVALLPGNVPRDLDGMFLALLDGHLPALPRVTTVAVPAPSVAVTLLLVVGVALGPGAGFNTVVIDLLFDFQTCPKSQTYCRLAMIYNRRKM